MKLGIKAVPGKTWRHDIESAHPAMVEIWYNASRPADYDELFTYLKDKPIDVGLHYWGALSNNLLTNISYPDPSITKPSLELMYATIDVAAAHRCVYVNIHPDLYSLLHVNFNSMDIRVASEPANRTIMLDTFMKNITELNRYAASKNVILTVETVPLRDTPSWRADRDRTQVIDIHPMPIEVLVDLSARGVCIANDLSHTACNRLTQDRSDIWRFLWEMTQKLAISTKLIHLGFVVPPYNGVDFHDSLANPVLNTDDAIPNKTEMIKLLQLFQNRDDMWILVEPTTDHVKNYFLAGEILEKARLAGDVEPRRAGVLTKKR